MVRTPLAALAVLILACTAHAQLPSPLGNPDFHDNGRPDEARVQLGKLLFFDKILSGSFNIACATCHHPFAGTGDGLSLSVGEGAVGTGVTRDTGSGPDAIRERVPRNAPALFNLGAREFTTLFHDGRVEPDPRLCHRALPRRPDSTCRRVSTAASPCRRCSPSRQALRWPASPARTRSPTQRPPETWRLVWELLAARLRGRDGYVTRFIAAFDDVRTAADITLRARGQRHRGLRGRRLARRQQRFRPLPARRSAGDEPCATAWHAPLLRPGGMQRMP